jgi:hypothetical protein
MNRLNTGALLLLMSFPTACGRQVVEFSTQDTTAPTVISTSPANLATGVPVTTQISATFSEAMSSATVAATTFTLSGPGSTSVAGTVTYAAGSSTATLTPATNLAGNTTFTARITSGVTDLAGNGLASPFVWSFTTAAAPSIAPPTVVSTSPANAATGVPLNRQITATFSEAMASASITTASFSVRAPGNAAVSGAVTYASIGSNAVFTPASPLVAATTYIATITTGAESTTGTALAAPFVWSFTTGAAPDTTAPTVLSTIPLIGATGVALNSAVTATFSEPMDPVTLASPATTFTVKESVSGNSVAGSVTYIGVTATFAPASALSPSTQYSSTVTVGAKDLAGNPMASSFVWSWTTGAAADTAAPTITVTNPAHLATNVAVNQAINATFSEEMKQATLLTSTFTVKETLSNNSVLGTVAYDTQNNIATLSPSLSLLPDTDYTATVTSGATDLAGNALVVPAVGGLPKPNPWTFKTAASVVPPPPLAINLRGAASFGIASRAGLTSTGVTVVNGDVALYPLATCTDSTGNAGASQTCLVKTYSSTTGMTVNGSIYWAGDPFDNGGTASSVTNDLSIAWTEGKNKADTLGAIAGNELGGKTFVPGVYHNAALGLAAGGIATIDAQNDANAIFIFKVDSSFVDSGTLLLPSQIRLVNGAQARNVWFVAGLDITIGSGTTWNGTILAGRTATVNDGSTVNGRVLAGASGAGAITLTGAAGPSVTTISVPQ